MSLYYECLVTTDVCMVCVRFFFSTSGGRIGNDRLKSTMSLQLHVQRIQI